MPRSENVKTPAFFSVGCGVRRAFVRFVALQEKLFGVSLPLPAIPCGPTSCQVLKEFCGGLLEDERSHPWYGSIGRLRADARKSIAMSLFLFRKCIPSVKPDCDQYLLKMSEPSPLPDGGFLRFCQVQIRKMFPSGWDRVDYPNAALSSVLTTSSCVQRNRAGGGCRYEVLSRPNGWNSHQDFVLRTLAEGSRTVLRPSRVTSVKTGGKWRIVSVGDVEMNILRPLHSAIYNRISRFDWLLRGEAKSNKFKDFTSREGEIFVSGDYESATDNLNMHVQSVLLRGILRGASWVPDHVKELAYSSQCLDLFTSSGKHVVQRSGQLMGNLLSFPLLCIVNYLAFLYYTGNDRSIPVRINGDDIVFRSRPDVARRWMEGVVGSGLVLSRGKTLTSPRYFSLNSRLFKGGRGLPRALPCVRSTAFGFSKPDDPVSGLRGRWARVRKDFPCPPARRLILEEEFLRQNVPYVVASRRSLTRGLDCRFSFEAISRVNLWKRESFYLSLEKETPMPMSPATFDQQRIPDGWELRRVETVTKEMRQLSRTIGAEFIACAWSPMCMWTGEERMEKYRTECSLAPYYSPLPTGTIRRRARLLGISVQCARRFLKPTILRNGRVLKNPHEILEVSRLTGKRLWLPAGSFQPTFVSHAG
jgi:hypothetical protein